MTRTLLAALFALLTVCSPAHAVRAILACPAAGESLPSSDETERCELVEAVGARRPDACHRPPLISPIRPPRTHLDRNVLVLLSSPPYRPARNDLGVPLRC